MNMPPIVSPQEWEAARERMLVKEKEHTRAGDALAAERRRMPRMAGREGLPLRGPGRAGEPARPLRRAPAAHHLPLLLRAGRRRVARERLPRLLDDGRPGRPPRAPQRPRHDVRARLAGAAGRHRALEGAHGLGASRGTRSPTTSTPTSASTSGTAPTSSSATATRIFRTYFVDGRGDEALGSTFSYLDITRARAPGGLGGLARGLPAGPDPPRVVAAPRRVRGRPGMIAHVAGVPVEEGACYVPARAADGDVRVAGPADRLGPRGVRPGRRLLPRHAVLLAAVAAVRRGAGRAVHRAPVGPAGLRPLVEAGEHAVDFGVHAAGVRGAPGPLGPRPPAGRRARPRRRCLAPRAPGRGRGVRLAVPGRRRRDPAQRVAVLPRSSRTTPACSASCPAYIHEAIVRAYIGSASTPGLPPTISRRWCRRGPATRGSRRSTGRSPTTTERSSTRTSGALAGSTSPCASSGVPTTPGSRSRPAAPVRRAGSRAPPDRGAGAGHLVHHDAPVALADELRAWLGAVTA